MRRITTAEVNWFAFVCGVFVGALLMGFFQLTRLGQP